MPATHRNLLALDVGDKRVGIAIASKEARLPRPLTTIERGPDCLTRLKDIIRTEDIGELVVGLPRGLDGQPTGQTEATHQFITDLQQSTELPVHLQDEAVTSKRAEAELQERRRPYKKGDIDALAATYILEDFLNVYNGSPG